MKESCRFVEGDIDVHGRVEINPVPSVQEGLVSRRERECLVSDGDLDQFEGGPVELHGQLIGYVDLLGTDRGVFHVFGRQGLVQAGH